MSKVCIRKFLIPDDNCKLTVVSGELMETTPNSFIFSHNYPHAKYSKGTGKIMIECKDNENDTIFKMLLDHKQATVLKAYLSNCLKEDFIDD